MNRREAALTPHARDKILAIYKALKMFDPPVAELFIDDLQETINRLEEDASTGMPNLDLDPTGETLSVRSGRDYFVLYEILDDQVVIEDVHVFGRAKD